LALPALACAEHKRILKFIPQSDLAILDPVWTTAYVTRNHGYMVFDTLYDQTGHEDGFKVTPQMAAGHVIENDGKTWKLTLRDFLQFHNGERVLASDCVTSIKRLGVRDAFGQALMARTDELFAPDDKTIVFRLKRPLALLPDALGHAASNMCAIMPRHIAETDPFKQITEKIPATVRQLSARAPVRRSSACAAATSLSHVVFATAQKNGNGPLTMPDTSVRHA
jgi:peptide/nickel transport system substrate-binding protein